MLGPSAGSAGGRPLDSLSMVSFGLSPVRLLRFAALVMDMCCAGLPLVPGSVAHTWAGFLAFFLGFSGIGTGPRQRVPLPMGFCALCLTCVAFVLFATCPPSLTHLWMAGDELACLTLFLGYEHVPYGILVLQFWDPLTSRFIHS